MTYSTLISADELHEHLNDANWVILDCRFAITDTGIGREKYAESHIPGALYVHLDEDLSGPILPGKTGRHPLPDIEQFTSTLRNWGIDKDTQVIAYDDMGGPFAARLWWMLQWLGHEKVAVLNGGYPAWTSAGCATTTDVHRPQPTTFSPTPRLDRTMTAERVLQNLESPDMILIDARAAERFAGLHEPLDPVAGHIPGARSFPFKDNLTDKGYFKPADQLRERFQSLTNQPEGRKIVCYCGSGVTAAHNILAMVHAGLPFPRMYAGSWSEWITMPQNPIGTKTQN